MNPFEKPVRIHTGFRRSFSFDYQTWEFPLFDTVEVQVANQEEHDLILSVMNLRAMRRVYTDIVGFLPVIRLALKSSTGQAQCDGLQEEAQTAIAQTTARLKAMGAE